ncbi:MAG: methyltransferase domain-containing protein [Rhodospirillales bacterium]|nr:methyltransferase domain-containing protein [Rhodospirillales bacterium]
MAQDDNEKKPAGSQMRAKLHAWWEGYVYEPRPQAKAPAASPAPAAGAADAKHPDPVRLPTDGKVVVKDQWPPERIKVAQLIWGDGFTFPGGEEFAVEMARPLALHDGDTAMDLGCGLGAGTRAIAKAYGAWMEGYDLSPDLAKSGNNMSHAANMERKAPIGLLDVVDGSFKPKRYDGALVRNVFSMISDKPKLLTRLVHGMKPGGRLVVVDWTIAREDAMGDALDAYRLGEATAPRLSTVAQFTAQLEAAGLAVKIADDFTDAFRAVVLEGWSRIETIVDRGQLKPDEGKALMDEAKLWSRRLAAVAAGDLRVGRFLAERKPA